MGPLVTVSLRCIYIGVLLLSIIRPLPAAIHTPITPRDVHSGLVALSFYASNPWYIHSFYSYTLPLRDGQSALPPHVSVLTNRNSCSPVLLAIPGAHQALFRSRLV